MTYQQTLDYLFGQLPMYQRVGKAAYKADLNNTIELCKLLDNPENKFKSIHIAGTNGKGSTSHMIASILQEAGLNVGLYTSPHLKDFRERIKINGEMIPEKNVIDFVDEYKSAFEKINLSFFEWTVGLAFDHFAKQQVDVAVIETGLGGRLDSTNAITPLVSTITNIGLDHTQFLGDTIEKIAIEKAGIIKDNIPVVIGETQKECADIFIESATKHKSPITFADTKTYTSYECDLKGLYQQKNIKTALTTIEVLKGEFKLKEEAIIQGLKHVVRNTGLMGRWQVLNDKPYTVCDTAHNLEGIKYIIEQIKSISYHELHIVFGIVNDKSIDKVLSIMPKDAIYYFCKPNIPRGLDAKLLQEQAIAHQLNGKIYESVAKAFIAAKHESTIDDMIYIGGSTFVVAEVV